MIYRVIIGDSIMNQYMLTMIMKGPFIVIRDNGMFQLLSKDHHKTLCIILHNTLCPLFMPFLTRQVPGLIIHLFLSCPISIPMTGTFFLNNVPHMILHHLLSDIWNKCASQSIIYDVSLKMASLSWTLRTSQSQRLKRWHTRGISALYLSYDSLAASVD